MKDLQSNSIDPTSLVSSNEGGSGNCAQIETDKISKNVNNIDINGGDTTAQSNTDNCENKCNKRELLAPNHFTFDHNRESLVSKTSSSTEVEGDEPEEYSLKQRKIHSKIVTAFTRAFAKQNIHFEKAIQSLDSINEQILSFAISQSSNELIKVENKHKDSIYQDAVTATLGLMRDLLIDAQGNLRKMVEENKSLAGRLDGDLQIAHCEMALLRNELSDTNKRISQLNSPPSTPSTPNNDNFASGTSSKTFSNTNHADDNDSPRINGISSSQNGDHDDLDSLDLESLSLTEIKEECHRLVVKNRSLQKELKAPTELHHAKEALLALKGDRKRLKQEKFELLSQIKQLYSTLEDKERELRDFIRNYEQRMKESETSLQRVMVERDEAERERWNLLRHARDETERGLALAAQLNIRELQIQQLQQDLHEAKRQLAQYGIYAEPDRSLSTAANSHYSLVSSLTATYATVGVGDRGSSADSGVRLSSDRDSGAGGAAAGNLSDSATEATEAISLDLGSGDGDSMSVISTATLPQLFTNSRDNPGPLTFSSSLNRSLDTHTLSRSAEQLAAEAAEIRRKNSRRSGGTDFVGRATTVSTGAKGAWGSISRVFARNKHRRTLDSALFDGMGGNQRISWSPQGPHSPITEQESYADKLRALEEAATLPMEMWRASMVVAWIEVSLGMPQYASRCADDIKSGKVLLELTDIDLEKLGILHPLHRKKLRLAIEEHRNPALVRFPCIAELSNFWVSSEWLPDIGLPQYAEAFAGGLVDARLLDHMSKKDLEKYLGVTKKFHMASIAHGVHLLRIVGYDRQALAERRRNCERDPIVWTNQHFVQWARSIDLAEYSENLKGSGVHGALCVLEPSFSGETLATAMGIPPTKQIIRRHLSVELETMLAPARAKITQQYRMTTKSRAHMLEKQRSDSLGRSAALSTEVFRRSTEDNRRRTSLRNYSHLFAQKGSLSRALGLKIKQDLLQRKSEERDHQLQRNTLGPPSTNFFSPPAPPLPAKFLRDTPNNPVHSFNFDPMTITPGNQRERPHSVLTMLTPTRTGKVDDMSERDSESESRESCSNSNSMSHSNSESNSNPKDEEGKQSRRVKSTGDVEQITIHTPV